VADHQGGEDQGRLINQRELRNERSACLRSGSHSF
jgi:hypothetical protein